MKRSHFFSFIKAFLWRTLGTMATLSIAFFVTGEFYISIGIAITEFIAKVILFYGHERVWIVLSQERGFDVTEQRVSVAKSVSWRATGTLATIIISFVFTGNPLEAVKIGLGEIIFKLVLFYGYERVWIGVFQWLRKENIQS